MKTAKSLQLLDAQNNNISPAVGVESIYFEKTDAGNGGGTTTNRKPLSFVESIKQNNNVENSNSLGDELYITDVSVNKTSDDGETPVYDLGFTRYKLGTVKQWIVGDVSTKVSGLSSDVNNNRRSINNINRNINNINTSLNNFYVRTYFNNAPYNSPNQLSGFRLLSDAVEDGKNGALGMLHGFPTAAMYNNSTDWYNNTKNSSYLSIRMGIDAKNSEGTVYHTGTNYFYRAATTDKADASLYFSYYDWEEDRKNSESTYILHAPSIQVESNKKFPYLPGYSPLWLGNGNSYILALAADNPSVVKPDNDTPVHLSWINSNALNNFEESKTYIDTQIKKLWDSSIAVNSTAVNTPVGTVKRYVDDKDANVQIYVLGRVNSSLGINFADSTMFTVNDSKTVKTYVDKSINNAKIKIASINKNSASQNYYLVTSSSNGVNSVFDTAYTSNDNLWYINQNNLFGGYVYSTSDERLKKDIKVIKDDSIEEELKPKTFTWKESEEKSYGFIAQELEKIYPELVATDKNGYKKVNYDAALTLLVGKLLNKIEILEDRIKILENK